MPLGIDPQVAAAMQKLFSDPPPPAPVGDWKTRRERVNHLFTILASLQPKATDVTIKTYETKAKDGHTVALRFYTKNGAKAPGSGVYYIHGGGMILGTAELYDETVKRYVSKSGVPFLSVEYRIAPEHPHPTLVEDCYAGLVWMAEHAGELGIDPKRIAVMGDSAGGGLAAGLALLARDRKGPALARQILVYPMLDDRSIKPDANIAPFATWTYDDNITGWDAYLNKKPADEYAAPARAKSLANLPPTYIDVGDLDVFRAEDVDYAHRLAAEGVATELHVHPGAPHAFEAFAPDADVSKRTVADRLRYIQSF